MSPMELLPTKILEKIFRYLPVHERVRVERVCKRWKYVSSTRAWTDVQGIQVIRSSPNETDRRERLGDIMDNTIYIGADALKSIQSLLSRAGQYVKEFLFVVNPNTTSTERVLSIVVSHCHNIESITFCDVEESAVKVISELLKVNEQLRSIVWGRADNIIEILPLRDWKLLRLSFSKENDAFNEGVVALVENSPSLENFSSRYWTPNMQEAISRCKELRTLELEGQGNPKDIMTIKTYLLNQLTSLTMPGSGDIDPILHLLRHCMNLESLNLFGFDGEMPLEIVRAVLALPKLENMFLCASSLTDQILSRLIKLRRLTIVGFTPITENGIFEMIVNSECLEILQISSMELSTNFFKRLLKKNNERRKILKIRVSVRIYRKASKICKGSKLHIFNRNIY